MRWMLAPYLVYLALFNFYAIYVFERWHSTVNVVTTADSVMFYSCQGLLVLFTGYFLAYGLR